MPPIEPKMIFDVGANIGAASVLMANTYPSAVINAFEPEPENFKLLLQNTEAYLNVRCFQFGLGAVSGKRMLYSSDDPRNFGGFSIYGTGVDLKKFVEVEIRSTMGFMMENRIFSIDIMKIDAEGAEFEILYDIRDLLPDYIVGEAHGEQDFKLFSMLSDRGMDVALRKSLGQRVYPFMAKKNVVR